MISSENKKGLDYGDSDFTDKGHAIVHSNSTDTDDKALTVVFQKTHPEAVISRDFIP